MGYIVLILDILFVYWLFFFRKGIEHKNHKRNKLQNKRSPYIQFITIFEKHPGTKQALSFQFVKEKYGS